MKTFRLIREWDMIVELADKRDNQKRGYKSTQNWNKTSTHLVGLCGEVAFSKMTGAPFDARTLARGDDGYDFLIDGVTYSVKTTKYARDPHLKEFPKPKLWADKYVLAIVDMGAKKATICGWCTGKELRESKLVDYGYGPQHSLTMDDIHLFPARTPEQLACDCWRNRSKWVYAGRRAACRTCRKFIGYARHEKQR